MGASAETEIRARDGFQIGAESEHKQNKIGEVAGGLGGSEPVRGRRAGERNDATRRDGEKQGGWAKGRARLLAGLMRFDTWVSEGGVIR